MNECPQMDDLLNIETFNAKIANGEINEENYDEVARQEAQKIADWIDSNLLKDLLEAGKKLNNEPIPLIGRYFWNPETNEVEAIK